MYTEINFHYILFAKAGISYSQSEPIKKQNNALVLLNSPKLTWPACDKFEI